MKDYEIVEAFSKEELTDRVKQRIKLGYEPIGGVMVVRNFSYKEAHPCHFYQAMILD